MSDVEEIISWLWREDWNALTHEEKKDKVEADVKKHSTIPCPKDGGVIKDCQVRLTAWCPKCKRFWRLRRHTWSWKVSWYYLKELEFKLKV